MVKLVSHAQEIKELEGKQKVAINNSLKALPTLIDNEVLIRVGGKLEHSTLPYQRNHHMILPANHHLQSYLL